MVRVYCIAVTALAAHAATSLAAAVSVNDTALSIPASSANNSTTVATKDVRKDVRETKTSRPRITVETRRPSKNSPTKAFKTAGAELGSSTADDLHPTQSEPTRPEPSQEHRSMYWNALRPPSKEKPYPPDAVIEFIVEEPSGQADPIVDRMRQKMKEVALVYQDIGGVKGKVPPPGSLGVPTFDQEPVAGKTKPGAYWTHAKMKPYAEQWELYLGPEGEGASKAKTASSSTSPATKMTAKEEPIEVPSGERSAKGERTSEGALDEQPTTTPVIAKRGDKDDSKTKAEQNKGADRQGSKSKESSPTESASAQGETNKDDKPSSTQSSLPQPSWTNVSSVPSSRPQTHPKGTQQEAEAEVRQKLFQQPPLTREEYEKRNWNWIRCVNNQWGRGRQAPFLFDTGGMWADGPEFGREVGRRITSWEYGKCGMSKLDVMFWNLEDWGDRTWSLDMSNTYHNYQACSFFEIILGPALERMKRFNQGGERRTLYVHNCGFKSPDDRDWSYFSVPVEVVWEDSGYNEFVRMGKPPWEA